MTKFYSDLLKTTIIKLIMVQEEKSGDYQSHMGLSSGT